MILTDVILIYDIDIIHVDITMILIYVIILTMRENTKFTYFILGKAFEKQIKTIEEHGKKQIKAIEEHEKQVMKSNAIIKKCDYNTEKDSGEVLRSKINI